MKKVVAFLLAILIFVAPVTTFVKADVVIGDNDETIINENATILGRKLALMESLSDLALSGVTEFTISNTNDVDSYFDSLWSEINDSIDYLDSGEWSNDISNELASKYFTNLVQYKDYINNRGDYLAHLLPSGNPTSNLLSTFFANNIYGKQSTLHNNLSLDMFRALNGLNRGSTPIPSPDPNYASYIDLINGNGFTSWIGKNQPWTNYFNTGKTTNLYWGSGYSYFYLNRLNSPNPNNGTDLYWQQLQMSEVKDVYIYGSDNSYSYNINSTPITNFLSGRNNNYYDYSNVRQTWYDANNNEYQASMNNTNSNMGNISWTYTGTLENVFKVLASGCHNINIYVNGNAWSIVGTVPSPILDIDGIIKIFGNDYPQQYELQPNTQIDYDQLYQVIYNAIRDNLPISQGDINYYDNHDTIYSPTIINNYGEEEGDESDLIDTILDYAVIPKFDTAIAQPMRQALTNGVVIMNNSITNVIPDEILLILGACFFLLLFAVVINRMIK